MKINYRKEFFIMKIDGVDMEFENTSTETEEHTPEETQAARDALMKVISMKVPKSSANLILDQSRDMIKNLTYTDCVNMTNMIKKHGIAGLFMKSKKEVKKIKKSKKA
jgi:DNA-directed RNA polymerase beta' subunit